MAEENRRNQELCFRGASDDLFYVEGDKFGEELGCFSKPCILQLWSKREASGLLVIGHYSLGDNGTWMIGVAQMEEDIHIPEWPTSFYNATGYSVGMRITVPEDCVITDLTHGKEDAEVLGT